MTKSDTTSNSRETTSTLLSQCRPVTSVEITKHYILVCEGPGISIFTKDGTKISQKIIAPSHKTILGISIYSKKETNPRKFFIFAFGQNFFRLVCFDSNLKEIIPILRDDNEKINENCNSCDFGNSFIAARWLNDGKKLAAITDENILHIFDWGVDAEFEDHLKNCSFSDTKITRRIIRGIPTSLFCATLSGSSEKDLIVFSGTNLSSIYIWAPQDASATHHLLVEGIKGSVLNVKYNASNGILVASSDQRSVFAWKLTTKDNAAGDIDSLKLYGSNVGPCSLIENKVHVLLIAEMVGHTGRVWSVDVWGDKIISAGQDSNLLVWDSNGKLLKIFSGSSVLSIRCCRFDSWDNAAYSGADDGSVCRWNLSDSFSTKTLPVKLMWELSGAEKGIIDKKTTESYPRQIISYDPNHFLVSKTSGQFILTDLIGRTRKVYENMHFIGYNISALSPSKKLLAIGSKSGYLHFVDLIISQSEISQRKEEPDFDYSSNSDDQLDCDNLPLVGICFHQKKFDSKIVSIQWADDGTLVVASCAQIFIILRDSVDNGTHDEDNKDKPLQWVQFFQFIIQWKDKPGVAAAIKITMNKNATDNKSAETTSVMPNNYMVLGDEMGGLNVFKLGQKSKLPLHTRAKVHGTYGVCDLKHGERNTQFWSVGRNRAIMHFKLVEEEGSAPSIIVLEVVQSCLNWNSRLHHSHFGSLLCGFSENDFVMVDLEEDIIVKKLHCGGAHRSWDVGFDKDRVTFGFIRHKELTVTQFGLDSFNIKTGIYGGKTMNVITTCPFLGKSGSLANNAFCIVTGGEDGVLRLTCTSMDPLNFQTSGVSCCKLAKFKGHASSVRVVKCIQLSTDSVLVLSAGGRSQIIASIILFKGSGNIVWSEEASIMLLQSRTSETEIEFPDSDMRIMGIHIEKSKTMQNEFFLQCACSDGLVRHVNFSLAYNQSQGANFRKSKFTLLHTFSLHQPSIEISQVPVLVTVTSPPSKKILHAITQVSVIRNSDINESIPTTVCANSVGELVLFSSPCNGDVVATRKNGDLITNIYFEVKEYVLQRIRRSGITAMDVLNARVGPEEETQSKFYVVTGSDDGIVALYLVTSTLNKNSGNASVDVKELWEDEVHHSAAVNSVSILKGGTIVAASADQVITVRSVVGELLKRFRCGVMDVQDMAVVQDSSFFETKCKNSSSALTSTSGALIILLVGQGFEIRKVEL